MVRRSPWKLALLALLCHLVLLGAWPLVRAGYAPFFRALAQFSVGVLDPLPGPIEVRFEPGHDEKLAVDLLRMDTVVRLRHEEMEGADATFGASSFFHGYVPTTVLLALFAAAFRRPWRAPRKPLLVALLLLHVFLALRCVLAVLYAFSKSTQDGRPLLDLGPTSLRILHLVWHFGWDEMLANYMVPLVVFGLCVFGPRSTAVPE